MSNKISPIIKSVQTSSDPTIQMAALHIRGVPNYADNKWLTRFINRHFGVSVRCSRITSKYLKRPRYLNFKIEFPMQLKSKLLHIKSIHKWNGMLVTNWRKNNTNINTINKNNIKNNLNNTNPYKNNIINNKNKKVTFANKITDQKTSSVQGNSVNYSNWVKGETINPYVSLSERITSGSTFDPNTNSSAEVKPSQPRPPLTPSYIDPMRPTTAKLTQSLHDFDNDRYILSRLRDNNIRENIRLYLAYLHDKPDSECIWGKTNTSLKVSIQQEGLPVNISDLKNIFYRYHERLRISSADVSSDLKSYKSHVSTYRTNYLNKASETHNKRFFPKHTSAWFK